MRTLAIGDIHGCLTAFETLLPFVSPTADDTIITLGDYVDRGPNTKGVLDRLLELHATGRLIPLRGNHEIMMLGAKEGGWEDVKFWLTFGGVQAIESYSPNGTLSHVPASHWQFIKETCDDWY